MLNLLLATAHKRGVHDAKVFKEAYDYYEVRKNPDDLLLDYRDCYATNELPEFVVDYCLLFWK